MQHQNRKASLTLSQGFASRVLSLGSLVLSPHLHLSNSDSAGEIRFVVVFRYGSVCFGFGFGLASLLPRDVNDLQLSTADAGWTVSNFAYFCRAAR